MARKVDVRPAAPGEAVLVTGASSGMGEDAARFLNELGYTVFGTVRHDADGERLRNQVVAPDRLHPVRMDVTDTAAVARARDEVAGRLRDDRLRLAGVFSNAGIALLSGDLSCEGCSLEVQQRVMDTNHFGAVRVTQAFLPLVRAARGTIVFNSALMARTVLPFNAGYAASKRALEGFADGLRREVAAQGVRVVLIEAAAISTALEAKQDPAAVPAGGLYPAQRPMIEASLGMQQRQAGSSRCDPRRVSELVAHAIASPRPRARYRVGGGSLPIAVLGRLPDRVQDRVFALGLAAAVRSARRSGASAAD